MNDIYDITAIVLLIISALLLITYCILTIIAAIQQKKDEDDYIKELDDHEKAVILNFKRLTRIMPRKRKKNVK